MDLHGWEEGNGNPLVFTFSCHPANIRLLIPVINTKRETLSTIRMAYFGGAVVKTGACRYVTRPEVLHYVSDLDKLIFPRANNYSYIGRIYHWF